MLTIQRRRPRIEVILARPEELDAEVERLAPEMVVCDAVTRRVRDRVASWVEVMLYDGLGANVCVKGVLSTLEDMGTKDLLAIVDKAGQPV